MNPGFWRGRRVLLTGHTGFKGAWLALWLHQLGARLTGYALPPATDPNLFEAARVGELMTTLFADVRDLAMLNRAYAEHQPEIVVHMAAQSLVRASYEDPVGTYATNVMGTVNVLEAARHAGGVKAALIITSDKCYENTEPARAYAEGDALGGHDPYSSSKACAEIVTAAYRRSFFSLAEAGGTAIATARAGNVIGGGDWADDRLVADMVRAFTSSRRVKLRYPAATRPWQHVLDPLDGYLTLLEELCNAGTQFTEAWNFGPDAAGERRVDAVADAMSRLWGDGAGWEIDTGTDSYEAQRLALDCSKARARLGWAPRLDFAKSLEWTAHWYKSYFGGGDARELSRTQINRYMKLAS